MVKRKATAEDKRHGEGVAQLPFNLKLDVKSQTSVRLGSRTQRGTSVYARTRTRTVKDTASTSGTNPSLICLSPAILRSAWPWVSYLR